MSSFKSLLLIVIVTHIACGTRVYSVYEAIDAMDKGWDIQTIQIYSNCHIEPAPLSHALGIIRELGGLKVNYYFQQTGVTNMINYYNTQLIVDIHANYGADFSVMYNIINATIHEDTHANNGSFSSYLHLHSSYVDARTASVRTQSRIFCNISNNTDTDGFYFTIPDKATSINHNYQIHNFEELYIAMEHGANIRMRINLNDNQTVVVHNGDVIQNNMDIFTRFMSGIHSENIANNWESTQHLFISWTTQQFIHDPSGLQFYVLSTSIVDVKGEIKIHSAIVDPSFNIWGWINVSAPFKQYALSFYSDLDVK